MKIPKLHPEDISQNEYFLMVCSAYKPVTFIDGNEYVDNIAREYFSSVNCQLMPNGSFVVNEFKKDRKDPFFNNVYIIDKDRNVVKQIEVKDGIDHECIVGSNTPRYYTPEFDYSTANENILYISMYKTFDANVADEDILDNKIIEMDWDGNVVWEWVAAEHFDEFGFTDEEKEYIKNNPFYIPNFGNEYDWLHLNSVCCVGENRWYDSGDERFNPDNLICSSRNRSMIFIISKETGKIVWKLKGTDVQPNFDVQHYAHIIPKGLEGAGNLLFFDSQCDGNSRIVELNPMTNEIVFEFNEGFDSDCMSSVQKLTDGNYLIGSAVDQRILVVNKDKEILARTYLDNLFYRVNAYPREWFYDHEYTDDEVAVYDAIAENELKHTPAMLVDLYIRYLNALCLE